MRSISCTAAPADEVMMAMRLGYFGKGFLCSGAKALLEELFLELLESDVQVTHALDAEL